MESLWKLGEGTVEDVRKAHPETRKSAYTTVQTVLNRLVDRGLVKRARHGSAFVYKTALDEAEYLSQAISDRLAGASPDARRAALVNLVGRLQPGDLEEVARYAQRIRRARGKT